jgi:predicted nucleic acid-binding protein
MSDYLIDSGILILHLRNQPGYLELTSRLMDDGDVSISAMTRLEIVRGLRERERDQTFSLLNSLETIPMTAEIADQAGDLIRSWQAGGVSLGNADAVIAASALQHGLALVTTNTKHFPMPDLTIFQVDENGQMTLRK